MLLCCVGLLGEALAGVRAGVGGLARPLLLPGGGVRSLAALPRLAPSPALGEYLHSGQLQTAASALSSVYTVDMWIRIESALALAFTKVHKSL